MVTDSILDSQKVTASLSAVDAAGFPVPSPTFDAPPVWGGTPGTGLTLVPSADGLSCVCSGAPGTYTINVSASAGGVAMAGSGTLQINPGAPASLSISFGQAQ